MKKLSYEFIKKSFEDEKYILTSQTYINARTKLGFICPRGHTHSIKWGDWKSGYRCGKCSNTNKPEHVFIEKSFNDMGYILLDKYHNSTTKMRTVCPNGHMYDVCWSDWKQGYRCKYCAKNSPILYEDVKKSFEDERYNLVDKCYTDCKTKMNFVCPNGHKHSINWSNWQQGVRCGKCVEALKTSKTEKDIVDRIKTLYSGRIIENDRTQIINPLTGYFLELDIFLPDIKVAIEYNGKYWHSNDGSIQRDIVKKEQCNRLGINLIVITDDDYKKDKDGTIKYIMENIYG